LHVRTSANITAMETAETRKHVAKLAEIMAGKLSTLENELHKDLVNIGEHLKVLNAKHH